MAQAVARYSVEVVDALAARGEILALAARSLPELTPGRYEKYYEQNPFGSPVVAVARDHGSGETVGSCALFPAEMVVAGRPVRGAVVGGFAVREDHRGYGPAMALQRELLSAAEAKGAAFVYANPNRAAEPFHRRLGATFVGQFERFVKPLRVAEVLRRAGRTGPVARRVGRAGDPLLSLLAPERLMRVRTEFQVEQPPAFDERFDAVLHAMSGRRALMGQRTVPLLNWRYETSAGPTRDRVYRITALLAGADTAAAYAVTYDKASVRHVADIAWQDRRALRSLLAELSVTAAREGLSVLSLLRVDNRNGRDELNRQLRTLGFVRRSTDRGAFVHLLAALPPRDRLLQAIDEGDSLLLTGDADL